MRESWTTFTTNTTLHGLRYVFTTSGVRRLFWVVCILTALSGYLVLLLDSFRTYMSLPINTEISHEYPERGLTFPQLTICNLNTVVKSKADVGYDDPRFKMFNLDLPVCQLIRNVSGNLTCGQALVCLYKDTAAYIIRDCNESMQKNLRHAVNTSSQRIFNPEDFLHHYGHNFDKMLLGYCMLGENPCNADDFDPVMTRKGLCFTFNVSKFTARAGEKASRVYFAGEEFGLSIILDAQSRESTFGDWSIGFRVIVSEEGIGVNREKGFNANPGSHVLVALTPKKIHRLPPPYKSNCSEIYLPGYRVYSKDACLFQCMNNKTIRDCGCRPIAEPGFPDVPVCSMSDNECVKNSKDTLRFVTCYCQSPCDQSYYLRTTSFSRFPTAMGLEILKQAYKVQVSTEYIRENLVFLQVGFATTFYEVSVEAAAYGPSSLFGDIGGNMGLLLGCSMLTVVEFIDFVFMFLVSKFQSKNNNTTVEDVKDTNYVGGIWDHHT